MERMGDKARAKAEMTRGRRAARAGHRGRRDARARSRRGRRRARLPGPAEGGRRRRRQGHAARARAGRARGRVRDGASAEARGGVRRRVALRREGARRPRATSRSRCSATTHGGVLTLGERECSIQRRHQKLDRGVAVARARRRDAARRWRRPPSARAARSATANAGTFEFLLGADGTFYFIELNARLQVEHPVTELVTGIDIVREQLRIAAGEPLALTGRAPRRGHAIEIRINAEDPASGFAPAPGHDRALPAAARAGRPRSTRIVEDGLDGLAVLRLADREARSCGTRTGRRRSRAALRALGELELGGVPTTRELALDILRSRRVRQRRVLDELSGGDGSRLPGTGGCGRIVSRDGHTIRGPNGTIRIDSGALARARDRRRGARSRVPASRVRGAGWTISRHRRQRARRAASSPRATGPCCPASDGRYRRTSRRARCDSAGLSVDAVDVSIEELDVMTTGRRQARRTGALPAVPVGSHGAAADGALRGRARRVRARSRRGRLGARRRARPPHHRGAPKAGPPTVSVRSSGTSCGSGSMSSRRRACRRRWR